MDRRKFVSGLSQTGLLCISSGCINLVTRGSIELHVLNWSRDREQIDVKLQRDGDTAFRDTFELDGGEATRETDIAPPGGYEVLVGVSSGPTNDFNFTMGDCSEQEITVIYERPRELTVDQKQC